MAAMSLHDIASRLAAARDVVRWTIWCAGDEPHIKDGERWAEIVGDPKHEITPCRYCGGPVDRYRFAYRILVGMNSGHLVRVELDKCRYPVPGGGCEWSCRSGP